MKKNIFDKALAVVTISLFIVIIIAPSISASINGKKDTQNIVNQSNVRYKYLLKVTQLRINLELWGIGGHMAVLYTMIRFVIKNNGDYAFNGGIKVCSEIKPLGSKEPILNKEENEYFTLGIGEKKVIKLYEWQPKNSMFKPWIYNLSFSVSPFDNDTVILNNEMNGYFIIYYGLMFPRILIL